METRIEQLRASFANDGFDVPTENVVVTHDRIGMKAIHRTARSYEEDEPKTAYYVEGSPFEMGYLLGRLAEPEIATMTELYIDRVFRAMIREAVTGERVDFTGTKGPKLVSGHGMLVGLVRDMIRARHVLADIPVRFHQEIRGIVAGCRETARIAGRSTQVSEEELWVLNAGLDCVLSRTYTGVLLPAPLRPRDVWMPIACNGFALLNEAAADGALFGRDFMFPTGGVFHRLACHVIHRPTVSGPKEPPPRPFVSVTAPGILGSIAGVNDAGVAAGVNMAVGGNCDPARPGFNSLLLVRDALERGVDIEAAARRIVAAQRGVSWVYLLAGSGDGNGRDRACVIEAGAAIDRLDVLSYPPERIKPLLPDRAFLEAHPTAEAVRGAMMRWDDYRVPEAYSAFNVGLCERFRKQVGDGAFGPRGRINRTPADRNCPGGFYFAPARGKPGEVMVGTNHYVIPEMRLCSMHPWAHRVFRARLNDSQWRYDELNHRILTALDEGPVDDERARDLLAFLEPSGDYPDYYRLNPRSSDGERAVIFGSLSLFDLRARTVESRYGWYGDPWVRLRLPHYLSG